MTSELGTLVRFGLVGITNTVVTFASYVVLTHVGVPPAVASAIAFGLGAALSAGGVALATSDFSVRRLAAEAVVLPIVTLVTYLLSRNLVFGGPEPA